MKAIKITLISLVVLIVVVVGGAAAFLAFVNPNDFKGYIADKVKEETGRTLTIKGNIEWGFWPKIRLKTGALSLSNAPGFGEQPMFSAKGFQIAVATLPLLRSEVKMDTVKLNGAEIHLARNKEGVSNWADLTKGAKGKKKGGGGNLAAVALGGVDISNATVTWNDAQTGQHATITDLNATTGPLTLGKPVAVKVSANVDSNKPQVKGDMRLDGTVAYDLGEQHYTLKPLNLTATLKGKNLPGGEAQLKFAAGVDVNLDKGTAQISDLMVDGLGTSVSGNVDATNIRSPKPGAKGKLDVKGKDLAEIFRALELPLAGQLASMKDRSFDLTTQFDADLAKGSIMVPELKGKLLSATVNGNLQARNIQSDKPEVKGMLDAQGPDLPSLMAVASQITAGRNANLKGLRAELAHVKDKSFKLSAQFNSDNAGNITVPSLQGHLLDTSLTGNLQARDVMTKQPAAKGKLSVEGSNLPTLLGVLGAFEGKKGAALTTAGSQLSGIKQKAFSISTEFDADMGKQTAAVKSLDAKLLGASLSGNLQASQFKSQNPVVKGKLAAEGPDLPALMTVFAALQGGKGSAIKEMSTQLAKVKDKSFKLSSQFDTDDKGNVRLPAFSAHLLGATVGGEMQASNLKGGKPAVKGSLKAQGPDLPSLLTIAATLKGGKGSSIKDIATGFSRVKDKSFAFNTDFDANLQSGRVNVSKLDARGLGATVNGHFKADNYNDPKSPISGQLSVKGTDMGPILAAAGLKNLSESVKGLTANAGVSGSANALTLSPLDVKATLGGKTVPHGPVQLALSAASAKANLEAQSLSVSKLKVTGPDNLNVSGDLSASNFKTKPSYKIALNVAPFNLRKLMQTLNQPLPNMADKTTLSKVGLVTDLSGTKTSMDLHKLDLTLDQTTVQGDMSLNSIKPLNVTFKVGVNAIDADRYLPPPSKGKKAAPVTPESAAAGAAQLPIETLRKMKVKGDMTIGKLKYMGAQLQNVTLKVDGANGKIALNPASADLYQGKYNGDVNLDATGKTPVVSFNSALTNVQLGPLLKDVKGQDLVTGTANIDAKLHATGADVNAFKRTLTGNAKFSILNGTYKGINIGHVLRQADALLDPKKSVSNVAAKETTDFGSITGTLQFNNGVVTNNDLDVKSPGMRATGKGQANLVTEQLDYTVNAGWARTNTGQGGKNLGQVEGITVPIHCKGTLNVPNCKPDFGELAKVAAKKEVQKQLEKALGIQKPQQQTQPSQQTAPQQQQQQPAKPEEQIKKQLKNLLNF